MSEDAAAVPERPVHVVDLRKKVNEARAAVEVLRGDENKETLKQATEALMGVRDAIPVIRSLLGDFIQTRDLMMAALRDQEVRRLKNSTIAHLAGLDDSAASRRALATGSPVRTRRR